MKKYANHVGYSDVNPYEVISSTAKTITLRAMECTQRGELKQTPGGFCAHTDNGTQKWDITSNPHGYTFKAYLHKNGFYYSGGRMFKLSDYPVKYYDYNF
jgi:hypothetical protein